MEKYGVCKTCFGRPKDNQDLQDNFVKTACGDFACPQCGQVVMQELQFDETIEITEETNEEKPNI